MASETSLNDEWITLVTVPSCATPEIFWKIMKYWTQQPIYKQIHKVDIISKEVDGIFAALNDEIPETAQKVVFRRRIYPRDYQRKREMEDTVVYYLHSNRIEFIPLVPHPAMKSNSTTTNYSSSKTNNDTVDIGTVDNDILPHYYIQAEKYAFQLAEMNPIDKSDSFDNNKHNNDNNKAMMSPDANVLSILRFEYITLKRTSQFANTVEKLRRIGTFLCSVFEKWARNERHGGYQKRVQHDVIVSLDEFTRNYRRLKEKYIRWVDEWEESTDPQKFVFEDIGIAAFLLSLWENERKETNSEKMQSFVDLGTGNGFLVYLLTSEGYPGKGIDIRKRKIWDKFSHVVLREEPIHPETFVAEEDWIIANHSDELTPWVPLIASRNNRRYFVLPCCEWDFDKRFTQKKKNKSRYQCYLEYIKMIGEISGYKVEVEHLRIPSTRNIAHIGRTRTIDPMNSGEVQRVAQQQLELLRKSGFVQFVPRFRNQSKHGEITKSVPVAKAKDKQI
jgi:hypothetical protein